MRRHVLVNKVRSLPSQKCSLCSCYGAYFRFLHIGPPFRLIPLMPIIETPISRFGSSRHCSAVRPNFHCFPRHDLAKPSTQFCRCSIEPSPWARVPAARRAVQSSATHLGPIVATDPRGITSLLCGGKAYVWSNIAPLPQ